MLNFSFHNPTSIHFGAGQIKKIDKEIPINAKVLVIYGGGSIKKNGVFDQVVEALGAREWCEYSGIEPNPNYDTLMKAVPLINDKKVDYLLAVGGGSVIDGVKFIAAAAKFEGGEPWDIIAKRASVTQAMPLGVVLTLPATGSESNNSGVVTRKGHKLPFANKLLRPQFAVLDPQVTLSLSDRQIGNGIVDAFVHVMEQYLTYDVNAKVQDRFSEGLLLTLIEEGPKALNSETKDDLEVRANAMWSATMALNGLIGAGVPHDWTAHMIGHELTGLYNIDHARTLSINLPAVMKVRRDVKRDKLLQYAERVWNVVDGSENQRIDKAIELTESFFKKMNVPIRLSEVDLDASHIDAILEKLQQHGMVALGEQREVTPDISRIILEAAL
ncbi:MAG: iron-containing alcohol dehydrogenase [Pseudomonadales bacterium]|nr:iron-containing alcohol dehydrogenase [Pseudomonadales bacterium]MDG2079680.1 iron-containing alcohol dehydrogenase [Pseudomonadales bacterium]